MIWIAWGKKNCSVSGCSGAQSSVASDQTGNSSKRECAGCEVSRVICQPFCSLWISTVLESGEGVYQ